MKYFEFGKDHPELMVMLHGGGVCYRGALPVAEEMAKTYHVVLAAYDGFNPDEPETEFHSVQDEARRLGDYIVKHYGGKIDILYGVSYGTFVLMDVLADERLTVTTTIADGMPTMDYADIKNPVLQNIYLFFLTGFAYWLIGKAGPIRRKIVCRIMNRSEASFDRIVYKDATWRSWVNQDKCMIGRHRNFELFKRTDMYIWHGIQSSTEKKACETYQGMAGQGLCLHLQGIPQHGTRYAGGGASGAVFTGSTGSTPEVSGSKGMQNRTDGHRPEDYLNSAGMIGRCRTKKQPLSCGRGGNGCAV